MGLAGYHLHLARQKIDPFKNYGSIKSINGIPIGIGEFVEGFNSYIENVNKANRSVNLAQVVGYIIAAITAGIEIRRNKS